MIKHSLTRPHWVRYKSYGGRVFVYVRVSESECMIIIKEKKPKYFGYFVYYITYLQWTNNWE